MTSSLASFPPLGQPSSSPGDCQVHNALRGRHVPGVLRVTDTADDWSSRQTAGAWGWECWRVWGCEGVSLFFVTFSLTALLLQSSWQGILPRWLTVAFGHPYLDQCIVRSSSLFSLSVQVWCSPQWHPTHWEQVSIPQHTTPTTVQLRPSLSLSFIFSPQLLPSLHRNLIEHMNAEIVLHTITDVSIALEWLRSTFLYIRVTQNPKHYGTHQQSSVKSYQEHWVSF